MEKSQGGEKIREKKAGVRKVLTGRRARERERVGKGDERREGERQVGEGENCLRPPRER